MDNTRLMRKRSYDEQRSWRYLDVINQLIDPSRWTQSSNDPAWHVCHAVAGERRGSTPSDARPLLLVEDPETRLHPIMLSVAWQLLNLLPLATYHYYIRGTTLTDSGKRSVSPGA